MAHRIVIYMMRSKTKTAMRDKDTFKKYKLSNSYLRSIQC